MDCDLLCLQATQFWTMQQAEGIYLIDSDVGQGYTLHPSPHVDSVGRSSSKSLHNMKKLLHYYCDTCQVISRKTMTT